jgi:Skp family chaperone for outer membrane proteins
MAAVIAAAVAAASVGFAGVAAAQDFFVPGQQRQGGGQARPPAQRQAAPPPRPAEPAPQPEPEEAPLGQIPVPPVPELPPLPRGAAPPAAVIGVIGLQDVMRASVAAQQADRIISERREKLNEDAQKEQMVWRDMQQALARDRAKLSADQIRAKERELQERITKAQREFRDRNRIIQEAAQFAINQVQSSLIAVIRQVADSRGMNLVLHRNQVALNVAEFDISEKVAEELNKVLPSVEVPPEGVSPAIPPTPTAGAPAGAAPVAAPAAPAPAAPPRR